MSAAVGTKWFSFSSLLRSEHRHTPAHEPVKADPAPGLPAATISGRLIEAQEQERSRLARELHDDINQRLALLVIEFEQLRLDPPAARKELVWRIGALQQSTLEISRDV